MKSILKNILFKILTLFITREGLLQLFSNKEDKALLYFKQGGYLYDTGWVNTIITEDVVGLNNQPLPWVTYPFIAFIEPRLNKNLTVFEFGSGNSTLYYASKTALVSSVEHDSFWYNKIKDSMPANVTLHECELQYGGLYSAYPLSLTEKFDLIIIDGRDRVNCCKKCITALKDGGVIILDDADRKDYNEGINFLKDQGFKTLDFWGTAPKINYTKCTTIFYKDNNCLAI